MAFGKAKVKNFNSRWIIEDTIWKSCKNNAFNTLFNAGLIIGLPLSSSIIKENKNDLEMMAKIWCWTSAVFRTFMFIISMIYIHQLLPVASISITFYGYTVCGFLTMLIFIRDRKKLYKVTKNLIHLSIVMNPGTYIGGKYINFYLLTYFASLFILAVDTSVFFFHDQAAYYKNTLYVPSFIPENSKQPFRNFVELCVISTFGLSVSACGYVFLLCSNLYETLARLIVVYGEKLKKRSERMAWSAETIPDDINMFKQLTFRIHEVDDAVNMYVFFLYGALISGFFNTVSVIVAQNSLFKTTSSIVYIIWIVVTAIWVLLGMSHLGSNIYDKGEEVKRQMVEYSDKFIRYSPSLSAMQVFNVLFDIIMSANMTVTGGGMFIINYGLILTIASVMVTYGVLILQLDK
ncbi:hypothetical protein HNY73_019767 [Argiope bruennichi]|uniref:Uncharacterized protein n=1 Tax=Argiope bruennichi TaxID=94029 RepID=A0A8T0E4M8_ARGBR|nr:hypothetical protein HNY73_019767 [Argiope bruennichi]